MILFQDFLPRPIGPPFVPLHGRWACMLHMLVRGEDVVCRKLRSSAGDVLLAYPQCDALKHTTLVSANLSQPAAGEFGCLTPSTPPPCPAIPSP